MQPAEREPGRIGDFLTLLMAEEIAHRQQTRLTPLTRRAHFPFLKTSTIQFTYQSTVRLQVLGSALSPDFVTEGRSLIFGEAGGEDPSGRGIAYRAIQNGFDAFFTAAATLIDDLSAAFRTGELANMLFHVNERHRRKRAMIFTTNKSLKAWGQVLHDEDFAQAIIDRVLERGRLFRPGWPLAPHARRQP